MKEIDCENCKRHLFSTDGKHVIVGGLIINPDKDKQIILCGKCNKPVRWERDK